MSSLSLLLDFLIGSPYTYYVFNPEKPEEHGPYNVYKVSDEEFTLSNTRVFVDTVWLLQRVDASDWAADMHAGFLHAGGIVEIHSAAVENPTSEDIDIFFHKLEMRGEDPKKFERAPKTINAMNTQISCEEGRKLTKTVIDFNGMDLTTVPFSRAPELGQIEEYLEEVRPNVWIHGMILYNAEHKWEKRKAAERKKSRQEQLQMKLRGK